MRATAYEKHAHSGSLPLFHLLVEYPHAVAKVILTLFLQEALYLLFCPGSYYMIERFEHRMRCSRSYYLYLIAIVNRRI